MIRSDLGCRINCTCSFANSKRLDQLPDIGRTRRIVDGVLKSEKRNQKDLIRFPSEVNDDEMPVIQVEILNVCDLLVGPRNRCPPVNLTQ